MSTASEPLGGRYRLDAKLGEGGMGSVWRGHDLRLGRQVAVKLLRSELAGLTADDRRLFKREARAAARAAHQGIVVVHDLDADADPPYLVMESLPGPDLAAVIRHGPLPVERVAQWGAQVAAALAHAHAAGVVHRDVKPSNLILDQHGQVKLCDFGIARLQHAVTTGRSLTSADIMTPHYAAPEQLLRQDVDHRADLYSFGVVLFELLTGQRPFDGSAIRVTQAHIQQDPPSVRTLRPEVPGPLADLVAQLMAKAPQDRPASAAEVCDSLRASTEMPHRTPTVRGPAAERGPLPVAQAAPPVPPQPPTVTAPRPRPYRPGGVLWHWDGQTGLETPLAVGRQGIAVPGDAGKISLLDPETGEERWTYQQDVGHWWMPRMDRDAVYATCRGMRDDAATNRTIALDLASGTERWSVDLPGSFSASPALGAENTLVGGNSRKELFVLSRTDGRHLHTVAYPRLEDICPTGNVVLVRSEGAVGCVDPGFGSVRWRTDVQDPVYRPDTIDGRIAVDPMAVFAAVHEGVIALGLRDGRPLWRRTGQGENGHVHNIATGAGLVFAETGDVNKIGPVAIYAYSQATGDPQWRYENPDRDIRALAYHNGRLYVTCSSTGYRGEQFLYALDAITGERVWQWLPKYPFTGPTVFMDGVAYVAGIDGVQALALPS
ncbi:protein kinase domain-containing protein [Streptomyces bambusae]|uniref:non-specific serine/threonine protein kinase n=1 Tax=Streptomyces bambusae TaxID=1550616 RepID=A0ABS6Z248_9ACTN|nr:serine/threonine-protein kinase [Streptomyces bambusae]MBW5481807.1 protein kinase [Streptomyces bambusae]